MGGEANFMSDCLFCKIVAKEIPVQAVYEDDKLLAIKDINPAAPVHILLIPKQHIASLNDVTGDQIALMGHIQLVAAQLARQLGIADEGYRLVNNCGKLGGQDIPHIHYHLLGGRMLGWPPG
jgi:histidine triad (HIT) family protein